MTQGTDAEVLHWPSWRYGPDNQSKICYSAEDVPDGWFDTPDKLNKAPVAEDDPFFDPRLGRRAGDSAEVIEIPADDNVEVIEPGELTRKQIMLALKAKGIKFKPTLSTALLRECLEEAEAAE